MTADFLTCARQTAREEAPLSITVAVQELEVACSSDDEQVYIERSVEELYSEALSHFKASDYEKAVVSFEEVERQHPYSVWATRAQLMAAYSNFLDENFEDALITLDRFIDLNPSSEDIAYAYYLRAVSLYHQISDVERDQRITRLALASLRQLVNNFPDSEYARDAKLKIDLARDHIAGKEMNVGRYYLRRGEYWSAINRFRIVVEQFETTTHVPEALLRLVEAYKSLGIESEAKRVAAVLGHNFSSSPWYREAYSLFSKGNDQEDLILVVEEQKWYSRVWSWVYDKSKLNKIF
ncbi:MAG: outer membrane protein assembly factor BamD [Pseudomonadota bacterium]